MARPVCVHCGLPYGQRWTETSRETVEIGCPIPPYRGNGQVVREVIDPPLPPPGQPDNPASYVPMDPDAYEQEQVGRTYMRSGRYIGRKGRQVRREVWDGESYYGGQKPFCTHRCAHAFAVAAYNAGFRPARKG